MADKDATGSLEKPKNQTEEQVWKLFELAHKLEHQLDRKEDAGRAYSKALDLDPTNPFANYAFASFMIRNDLSSLENCSESAEKVLRCLETAKKTDETNTSELYNLIAILSCRVNGDFEKAGLSFEKSIELDSKNVDALYNYANFLDQALGDSSRAAEFYQKVIELNPNHVTAMNNYAAFLVEKSKAQAEPESSNALKKAKMIFEKANELSPGLPAFNLACVSSLQNDGEQAKHWLSESFRLGLIDIGEQGAQLLMEDPDLENVKQEPWFLSFCENLRSNTSLSPEEGAMESS
mmetsp:Transcript_8321/g.10832  ORF Transcript_8321/g.10832 Transcript_8321/m.10832 type:complete len:293 (+) Transcript_8321:145-1023(+)